MTLGANKVYNKLNKAPLNPLYFLGKGTLALSRSKTVATLLPRSDSKSKLQIKKRNSSNSLLGQKKSAQNVLDTNSNKILEEDEEVKENDEERKDFKN